jgi:hypothetical protein
MAVEYIEISQLVKPKATSRRGISRRRRMTRGVRKMFIIERDAW